MIITSCYVWAWFKMAAVRALLSRTLQVSQSGRETLLPLVIDTKEPEKESFSFFSR